MTVTDLRDRMPQQEFVEWKTFYARRSQREELERKKAKHKGRG